MQKSTGRFHTPLQQIFLLEERVRQAGVQLPDEADNDLRFHGIKCIINDADCVVNLRAVAEVIDGKKVTPIPGTEQWVEGVMNYRGVLVPVYCPDKYLTSAASAPDPEGKHSTDDSSPLLVIRKDRKGNEFNAVRVSKVAGMQKFRTVDLQPFANTGSGHAPVAAFVDELINTEGRSWYRLDITRLLDEMAGTSLRKH